jgi:hypothetical protein
MRPNCQINIPAIAPLKIRVITNGTMRSSPRNPLPARLSNMPMAMNIPPMANDTTAKNIAANFGRFILGSSTTFVTLRLSPQRLQ